MAVTAATAEMEVVGTVHRIFYQSSYGLVASFRWLNTKAALLAQVCLSVSCARLCY